jgi:hypothetical protein
MNSELSLWDHLLSPDALRREVKPGAEIKFGGSKKLPQHKHVVKTSKTVIPEDIFIIISTDSNGLKYVLPRGELRGKGNRDMLMVIVIQCRIFLYSSQFLYVGFCGSLA